MGGLIWFSQILCLSFILLQFRVQSSSPSQSSLNSPPHLFHPEEHSALLDFKSTTNMKEGCFVTPRPIIQTWNERKDCCLWEGITCDKRKGHVIGLDLSSNCLKANLTTDSSLFRLEKLQSLNLSYNYFHYPNISFGFDRWKSLTYLNLSDSDSGYMDGSLLFDEIFLPPKLVSLDLSHNHLFLNNIKFQMLVHNLTELRELRFLILDYVNMSLAVPSSLLNLTSSLEHLSLRSCNLQGNFPSQVFQLKKLVSLDLSDNYDLLLDNIKFQMLVHNLTELRKLSEPFFQLKKVVSLDLSHNDDLFLDKFQMLVHNLTELRFLILDSVNMALVVPSSLLNLTSSLEHLSLSDCFLQGNFPNQVFQLPSLQLLDLSYNFDLGGNLAESNQSSTLKYLNLANTNFSGELPHSIGKLKLLKKLNLHSCQFYGSIPRSLANLSKITYLDFSFNLLQGRVPSWLFSLPSLFYLNLQNNSLTGPIDHIEMPNLILEEVHLSNNEINGPIPSSLFDLVSLRYVSLSSNNLSGTITPNMLSKLVHLATLDLSSNSLLSMNNNDSSVNYSFPRLQSLRLCSCNIYKFPSFLRKAERLHELDISKNKISGQIHKWEIEGMPVVSLDLSYNFLTSIDLFAFGNLEIVDLRSNLLQGLLPILSTTWDSIRQLFISGNNLTGEIPSSTCNFTSLRVLVLANNNLGGKIPACLGNLTNLSYLDLRMNKFHGRIPNSFVNKSELRTLDLNGNQLEGILPRSLVNCSDLEVLDVGNNSLNDTFPHWLDVLPSLQVLSLQSNRFHGSISTSENNLTGDIPSSLCNFSSLRVLDLAKNSLEGGIPECLGMFSQLSVMDLRMNKFLGGIPNSFVNNTFLRTLNLNSNQLEGKLPRSLVNCSLLEVLDVGNNYFNDIFPHWLGVLPRLQVLILQSNRFHGSINNSMTVLPSFPQLRIIDISQNQFDGLLPTKYFQNFKAMRDVYQDESGSKYIGDSYYKDSVRVIIKDTKVELVNILKTFTTVDLSSNGFHGYIPQELGELNSLILLNLSHNSLTGPIPSSLGKMTELESLDFSSNKLEGRIPEQLIDLAFLSVLQLSHNELVGQIPQGKQFNTFSNDSYIGNSGLCGLPLTKKCHNEEEPGAPPSKFYEEKDESATLFNWKFALAGYGCGLVLGLSLGYIAFTSGKPWWMVKKVEKYQQKFVGRCNGRHKKRKTQKPNQRS
ncbi:hypothetical protein SLEP1_g55944 [Rubroshorea leprosula]|uniref:Leucine-rich repeat-containing N-terminal plant-type domain-containing protein n=1 Tax=Rubroshorea leprosula TaxID=152421 RepID=A0AAV5MK78_9ROSI|nr:hypothetical protein SLEP1_g55944 [Rubroshorea leprosula]